MWMNYVYILKLLSAPEHFYIGYSKPCVIEFASTRQIPPSAPPNIDLGNSRHRMAGIWSYKR
jgi:hypothetical protein